MKKTALVIITVLLTFLLASCDVSGQLEDFSNGMLDMMADNLQGILKDADKAAESEESSDDADTSSDTETTDDVQENGGAEQPQKLF